MNVKLCACDIYLNTHYSIILIFVTFTAQNNVIILVFLMHLTYLQKCNGFVIFGLISMKLVANICYFSQTNLFPGERVWCEFGVGWRGPNFLDFLENKPTQNHIKWGVISGEFTASETFGEVMEAIGDTPTPLGVSV